MSIPFENLQDNTWYMTQIDDGPSMRTFYIRPHDGIDSYGYRSVETWPIDRSLDDIPPGVPLRTSRVDDRAHIKFFPISASAEPFAAFDAASADLARLCTEPPFAAFDAASAELARLCTEPPFAAFDAASAELARLCTSNESSYDAFKSAFDDFARVITLTAKKRKADSAEEPNVEPKEAKQR